MSIIDAGPADLPLAELSIDRRHAIAVGSFCEHILRKSRHCDVKYRLRRLATC